MQTRIQGLSTHYIDLPGEKGPVLFLHGWGAHIGLYQPIFDLLQQQGYRVVAFDMPGVGQTDEPDRPLTVADYVSFTLELCARLGHTPDQAAEAIADAAAHRAGTRQDDITVAVLELAAN